MNTKKLDIIVSDKVNLPVVVYAYNEWQFAIVQLLKLRTVTVEWRDKIDEMCPRVAEIIKYANCKLRPLNIFEREVASYYNLSYEHKDKRLNGDLAVQDSVRLTLKGFRSFDTMKGEIDYWIDETKTEILRHRIYQQIKQIVKTYFGAILAIGSVGIFFLGSR